MTDLAAASATARVLGDAAADARRDFEAFQRAALDAMNEVRVTGAPGPSFAALAAIVTTPKDLLARLRDLQKARDDAADAARRARQVAQRERDARREADDAARALAWREEEASRRTERLTRRLEDAADRAAERARQEAEDRLRVPGAIEELLVEIEEMLEGIEALER